MSGPTKIEWADAVWNPVTGCTKVSAGCKNCYAERQAKRFAGRAGYPAADPFAVTLHPERLDEPLRWRKPRRIFVCSMSDLFHPDVPDEFIAGAFGVMAACRHHIFQILTKRPERATEWFEWIANRGFNDNERIARCWAYAIPPYSHTVRDADWWNERNGGYRVWPLPNVWLGTSVEDQASADERIPYLLRCPAAVRFVSAEPLIGSIDLSQWLRGDEPYDRSREVLSGVGGNRGIYGGRERVRVETSETYCREQDGGASLLAAGGAPAPGGCVDLGRVSDGNVLGREQEAQDLRPSIGLDASQPGGHSCTNGGEPQGRRSREQRAIELGTHDTVGQRVAWNSRVGTKASGPAGSEESTGAADRESSAGNPTTLQSESYGSEQGGRDVRNLAAVSLGNLPPKDLETSRLVHRRLHWLIAGGESGPNARPCHLEWMRTVVGQCRGAGVPVFVKQLGHFPSSNQPEGTFWEPLWGDKACTKLSGRYAPCGGLAHKGGNPADWPEDLRVREFPSFPREARP